MRLFPLDPQVDLRDDERDIGLIVPDCNKVLRFLASRTIPDIHLIRNDVHKFIYQFRNQNYFVLRI